MASEPSESGDSSDTHKQRNNQLQNHDNDESTGDEFSEAHDAKNEPWNRVNGDVSPTNDKVEEDDAYGASADTREEKHEKINARQPGSDTETGANKQQTLSKEEAKPVKEALVETEKGTRRRRRRRNQPAWYDADNEKAQEKQLAETRPQELQQVDQRQQQQLDFQQQQQQLEFQRKQMEMQLREQQLQAQQSRHNNSLKLRLDLNLDVEVTLKAKIHGDLTLSLLYVHPISFASGAIP
ncbi:hypothetical protein F4861DRAFT_50056 [Xylaria intraflava]|nr:hypothetical protein F4861DRAFT_50056 [Xylaria intraflava]